MIALDILICRLFKVHFLDLKRLILNEFELLTAAGLPKLLIKWHDTGQEEVYPIQSSLNNNLV